MGESFWFQWFGKPLSELYAIKETQWNELTDEQKIDLDRLIAKKENEAQE